MILLAVIAVFVYLAVGLVVLDRAEEQSGGLLGSILDTIVDPLRLLGVVAWPALLALRLGSPRGGSTTIRHMKEHVSDLAGQRGKALSDLKPWGKVEVDGETFSARVETGFVPSGATVKVLRVENSGLVVRVFLD